MFGKLDRYILRSILNPLAMALCVAAMLLTLERMLRLFDFVLDKNGPVDVVWQMLGYLLPHYLGLALPLGLFIGILMAFRGLSLSSELDAITASGVSMRRLLVPVFALTTLLMLVDFILVSYLQPYAQYRYRQLWFEVSSGALGITVPAGEFVQVADGVTLFVGSTQNENRRLKDIFLERRSATGNRNVFTAAEGAIFAGNDEGTFTLRLFDGRQMQFAPDNGQPAVLKYDKLDVPLELPQVGTFRERGGEKKEATIAELVETLNSESAETFPDYNAFRASFHWRLIHPLTFLALPMLAVAMGVVDKRRPSVLQPVVGIALVILYHEILEEWGEVQVATGQMSPWIAMWPIYIAFFALGAVLFRATSESPGGLHALTFEQRLAQISSVPMALLRRAGNGTQ